VPLWFCAAKPPNTRPARAITNRIAVEIKNALLRSFEAISRSATSQIAAASVGAAGRGVREPAAGALASYRHYAVSS
jgi:hypothetical protein